MNAALFTHCCHFDMLGGQEPPNNAQKRANRCTCLRRLKNVCAPWPPCGSVLLCCAAFWAQGAEWLWKMAEEQGPRHSAAKAVKAFMKLVQHGSTNPMSF